MVLPNGNWDTQRARCQLLGGDLAVYNEWVTTLLFSSAPMEHHAACRF